MRTLATPLLFLCLAGCADKAPTTDSGPGATGGDGRDGASGDGADGTTDGDDGTMQEEANAWIEGTVRVQLFTEDSGGDVDFISWPSSYDGFPFGRVWVGARNANLNSNDLSDSGTTTVDAPTSAGDTYTMGVRVNGPTQMLVYGALDYWDNDIIHTTDPFGNHPQQVTVNPGETLSGVDFTILAPYTDLEGRSAADAAAEDQLDERSHCDDVTITGPFEVVQAGYPGGNGMAMLRTREGDGPFDWGEAVLTETEDGTGAAGTYSISTCADLGYVRLVGRWDNNRNQLYDPHDQYGAFSVQSGVDGNPIAIASVDLSGYRVEAPVESDDPINVVPFVQLSGTLSMPEGFDALPTGASVMVAATKYRLQGDIAVDDFDDNTYGFEVFEWPDITGTSSLNWSMVVPTDTLIYLWAYADENANGVVNESGEAVASGGEDDNGRMVTSADSTEPLNLILNYAGE